MSLYPRSSRHWFGTLGAAVFILTAACNLPFNRPYTGIAPILTATAAARQQQTINNDPVIPVADMVVPDTQYAYTTQSGDTVSALASRFQVPGSAILSQDMQELSNTGISTLPPGKVLIINLGQKNAWSKNLRIIPDNFFIFSLTQADFDTRDFLVQTPGWLGRYVETASGRRISGTEILIYTANNYSISPKVLLAILEYQLHAISDPTVPASLSLGSTDPARKTLMKHLSWAANALNNGYYGWREGVQTSFYDSAGNLININPESNAGSVAFQYYFSQFLSGDELSIALSDDGFLNVYKSLFGEIDWEIDWKNPIFPENLQQPDLSLPLQPGLKWAYTGGPHSPWGIGYPFAAVDFAPPALTAGCDASPYWVSAVADGVISRSEEGILFQDLDGDGITQTGWVIQYLHLSPIKQLPVGIKLKKGEQIGHPSCAGGNSSGRNIHIARMYNGEWVPTGGPIPLNLGGWIAINGEKEYKGILMNGTSELRASGVGEYFSQFPIK